MDVRKVLHMNEGDREYSYAQHSRFTQRLMAATKPILEAAIASLLPEAVLFGPLKLINAADLGCSAGPNTYSVISSIKHVVKKRCHELNLQVPEIQIYLNDLPGNDFNSLFRNLPATTSQQGKDFHLVDAKEEAAVGEEVRCFIMGTPGSFHGRLFPARCLHFVHSSYGVQWLSKGLIEQEKLDSFDVPYYTPTTEEFQLAVANEGSFEVQHMEILKLQADDLNIEDIWVRGEKLSKNLRCFTEPLLSHHFGGEIMDQLYDTLTAFIVDHYSIQPTITAISIVAILKRKVY
ncbi:hypothetical protein Ancab_034437 [Ancistrocladus abbreviatus]